LTEGMGRDDHLIRSDRDVIHDNAGRQQPVSLPSFGHELLPIATSCDKGTGMPYPLHRDCVRALFPYAKVIATGAFHDRRHRHDRRDQPPIGDSAMKRHVGRDVSRKETSVSWMRRAGPSIKVAWPPIPAPWQRCRARRHRGPDASASRPGPCRAGCGTRSGGSACRGSASTPATPMPRVRCG